MTSSCRYLPHFLLMSWRCAHISFKARQDVAIPLVPDCLRCNFCVVAVFVGCNASWVVLLGDCIHCLGWSKGNRVWLVPRAQALVHKRCAQDLRLPSRYFRGEYSLWCLMQLISPVVQIIQSIWSYLIFGVAFRVLKGEGAEDSRSDDEG